MSKQRIEMQLAATVNRSFTVSTAFWIKLFLIKLRLQHITLYVNTYMFVQCYYMGLIIQT